MLGHTSSSGHNLSVDHFSPTFTGHTQVHYSLPVQWDEAPTRCYSLYEEEERMFSLPIREYEESTEERSELRCIEEVSQVAGHTLGAEEDHCNYSVMATEETCVRPDPETVEKLYKFGFLTDQEYNRKLRQIEGLPSQSSSSTEEEEEVKEPLCAQLLGGMKAMMDHRELEQAGEVDIFSFTPEPIDYELPLVFTWPDYVPRITESSNRYGALKKPETLPDEPWKIPSVTCVGTEYYTLLKKRPYVRVSIKDPMDFKYIQSIRLEFQSRFRINVRLDNPTITIDGDTTEQIEEALLSLYTICKRYTIKKVSTTKREALEFVQKFHLGTLNELEAHTGTKILIFQDEEARGFLVTGKRTEIGRAVEAMKQLLGRVIVNTLQFPKHQWLEALYPNDLLDRLCDETQTKISVKGARTEWIVQISGLQEGVDQASKAFQKRDQMFTKKVYYLAPDLSDNGWNKKDDNCRKKPRTFHMNLINLNKKALITRISEKSFVKNVEIHAHTHCQGSIVCYGTEEELLKAGWEIDKIIVEYRACEEIYIALFQKNIAFRLIGSGGKSLKQIEVDTGCVYSSIVDMESTSGPRLLLRGSISALEKARDAVNAKITAFRADDEEKKRQRDEERAKKQKEWEEKQKLIALRNRRRPGGARPVKK